MFTDTSDEKPEKCGICEQITKELQYDYEEKEFMCRICIQEKEELSFCYICSQETEDLHYDCEEDGFICETCIQGGENDMIHQKKCSICEQIICELCIQEDQLYTFTLYSDNEYMCDDCIRNKSTKNSH